VVPHGPCEPRGNAHERPGRCRVVLAVDHHDGVAVEDDEDLLLVALGLVVLRDRVALLDLDDVEPERLDLEPAANELPAPVRLELPQPPDGESLGHGAERYDRDRPRARGLSLPKCVKPDRSLAGTPWQRPRASSCRPRPPCSSRSSPCWSASR